MSDPLRPGELNCRITLSYMETERGELGETLPAREVSAGKAWSKKELVSGRKVRTLDQQQVVETTSSRCTRARLTWTGRYRQRTGYIPFATSSA